MQVNKLLGTDAQQQNAALRRLTGLATKVAKGKS